MTNESLLRSLRARTVELGVTLRDIAEETGKPYQRVQRFLAGYRAGRPGEAAEILAAAERIAQRRQARA